MTITDEFRINQVIVGNQSEAQIAPLPSNTGGFIVVWTAGNAQDGQLNGVFGQIYTETGQVIPQLSKLNLEFQINTETFSNQESPSISV